MQQISLFLGRVKKITSFELCVRDDTLKHNKAWRFQRCVRTETKGFNSGNKKL